MAFITAEHIYTHLNQEIVEVIEEGVEAAKLQFAIDAAIEEVGSYLGRYDTETIFAAEDEERHPLILLYTKDVAVWHYIQLANPNIDMALRERRFELATAWLTKVQSGKVTPDLPLPAPSEDDPQKNSEVRYGSARTRQRGYL